METNESRMCEWARNVSEANRKYSNARETHREPGRARPNAGALCVENGCFVQFAGADEAAAHQNTFVVSRYY